MKVRIAPEKLAHDLAAAAAFYQQAIATNERLYEARIIDAVQLAEINGSLRLAAGRALEASSALLSTTHFTLDGDVLVAHV